LDAPNGVYNETGENVLNSQKLVSALMLSALFVVLALVLVATAQESRSEMLKRIWQQGMAERAENTRIRSENGLGQNAAKLHVKSFAGTISAPQAGELPPFAFTSADNGLVLVASAPDAKRLRSLAFVLERNEIFGNVLNVKGRLIVEAYGKFFTVDLGSDFQTKAVFPHPLLSAYVEGTASDGRFVYLPTSAGYFLPVDFAIDKTTSVATDEESFPRNHSFITAGSTLVGSNIWYIDPFQEAVFSVPVYQSGKQAPEPKLILNLNVPVHIFQVNGRIFVLTARVPARDGSPGYKGSVYEIVSVQGVFRPVLLSVDDLEIRFGPNVAGTYDPGTGTMLFTMQNEIVAASLASGKLKDYRVVVPGYFGEVGGIALLHSGGSAVASRAISDEFGSAPARTIQQTSEATPLVGR